MCLVSPITGRPSVVPQESLFESGRRDCVPPSFGASAPMFHSCAVSLSFSSPPSPLCTCSLSSPLPACGHVRVDLSSGRRGRQPAAISCKRMAPTLRRPSPLRRTSRHPPGSRKGPPPLQVTRHKLGVFVAKGYALFGGFLFYCQGSTDLLSRPLWQKWQNWFSTSYSPYASSASFYVGVP